MPFKDGNKKGVGRKKGIPNKDTAKVRGFLGIVMDRNLPKFEKELNKLEGIQYINTIVSLLEYSVPKLQRTELTGEGTKQPPIKITVVRDKDK